MNLKKMLKMSDKNFEQILKRIINILFQIHKRIYFAKNINYPEVPQCLFALWHAHQCGIYSFKNRNKINVMISRSRDGEIIAYAAEKLNFKTVRGSKTRGGAAATLELVERIKKGDSGAITIDGPKGPKYVVKKGIVEIAKITGVPIVPMTFYGGKRGFFRFKTWDEFCYPVPFKKLINIYGKPIYVPLDADENKIEEIRKQIEDELHMLYKTAVSDYKKLVKS